MDSQVVTAALLPAGPHKVFKLSALFTQAYMIVEKVNVTLRFIG
jgi:hypothetical protein